MFMQSQLQVVLSSGDLATLTDNATILDEKPSNAMLLYVGVHAVLPSDPSAVRKITSSCDETACGTRKR